MRPEAGDAASSRGAAGTAGRESESTVQALRPPGTCGFVGDISEIKTAIFSPLITLKGL